MSYHYCCAPRHRPAFWLPPNPAASDKERGEVILWIDGKPALYASDMEQELYSGLGVFSDEKAVEPAVQKLIESVLRDKIKVVLPSKEKTFDSPECKKLWDQQIEKAKSIVYAEYFLKQYKGKEVVEFIDTEGKSSFGEIEKIDFSKAQKDLIKEFNVALYPENVNKTNAVLITANGKPILIEEGAKTSEEIDEKQQGHPFQTMYHVSSAEAAKKLNLETFAAIYALELWVKKNNIKIEGEYQKKLDDLLASYKPAAIDQCFDIYFNSPSRMDDLKKEVKARWV